MGKMLIPKPFIIIKMSDSDRVPLDIIKLIMPSMGGKGGADKKWNVPLPAAI